jgi:hypothetical protein
MRNVENIRDLNGGEASTSPTTRVISRNRIVLIHA